MDLFLHVPCSIAPYDGGCVANQWGYVMARIIPERMTAEIDGDFVVFLIGMRVNKWWKVNKWLPAGLAMMRMLKELSTLPKEDTGFLGVTNFGAKGMVQYWRSFDALEAYAGAANMEHQPAWAAFNKRVKNARGDVGIWHETYVIRAGDYENVYSGMPRFGLGNVADLVPATADRTTARKRMGARQ